MTNGERNPKVDKFLGETEKWREEFEELRRILLGCGLAEDFKWGKPCYTFQEGNVVLIHGFKEYCALLFIKGALLRDEKDILVQQTEHVQAGRQVRFTGVREIMEMESVLKEYVLEAVEAEKAGLEVEFKKSEAFAVPEEFQAKLQENPALKTAFEALTPGRQRAYLLHFSEPKQAKTRAARVEKWTPHILNGKGLQDER